MQPLHTPHSRPHNSAHTAPHTSTHPGGLKLCCPLFRDGLEELLHGGAQHAQLGPQLCRIPRALGVAGRHCGIVPCHKGSGLAVCSSQQRVQLGALCLAHGAREVVHALALLHAAALLLLQGLVPLLPRLPLQLGNVHGRLLRLSELGVALIQQALVGLNHLGHLLRLVLGCNAGLLHLLALAALLPRQLLLPLPPRLLLLALLALLLAGRVGGGGCVLPLRAWEECVRGKGAGAGENRGLCKGTLWRPAKEIEAWHLKRPAPNKGVALART